MIRLAIAEDHPFLAKSIKDKCSFFDDITCKFIADDGKDLLDKLEKDHLVDVILMDIQMPHMDCIEATEIVKRKYPHIRVIMLTVFDDEDRIFSAIKAGADGYLLKDENAETIHSGILDIMNGGAPMSPAIALKSLKLLRSANIDRDTEMEMEYTLTTREVSVLEQLSKGLKYQEIADNLCISNNTVRKHIENTYRKLHVRNKVEAISLAQQKRLI